jgi:hypothetical protein
LASSAKKKDVSAKTDLEAIDDTVDVLIADRANGTIETVFVHTQQRIFQHRSAPLLPGSGFDRSKA